MKRFLKVALLTGVLVAGLGAQGVTAATYDQGPVQYAKSVSQRCVGGVKIEDPVSGVAYNVKFDGYSGTITFTINGGVLAFDTDHSSHVITGIWIKGGPDYAWAYFYTGGEDNDGGLTAPSNPNSGGYYGVSHVCLTLDKK